MDIGFHSVSAAWLAHRLGERRRAQLALAVLIGILPDIIAVCGKEFFACRTTYRWAHALTIQAPLLLLLLLYNRRIAWGGILHIGIDALTHTYATRYLLYPLAGFYLPIGITWYRGWGWLVWGALWASLLTAIHWERRRHTKPRLPDQQTSA